MWGAVLLLRVFSNMLALPLDVTSTSSCNYQNSTETFSNISQETRSPPVENRGYREKVLVWTQVTDKSACLRPSWCERVFSGHLRLCWWEPEMGSWRRKGSHRLES